jgi:ankyrin repeat protein
MLKRHDQLVKSASRDRLLRRSISMSNDSDGQNPRPPGGELFDAVERNDVAAVEELLSRGADVNTLDPRYPQLARPALMTAASLGYSEIVRLLLANGADVNARDAGGGTAFIWACNDGHIGCTRLLLVAGADPSLRNNGGYTAYGRIMTRNEELMRLVEEHGGSL